jgi:hypothetical protein
MRKTSMVVQYKGLKKPRQPSLSPHRTAHEKTCPRSKNKDEIMTILHHVDNINEKNLTHKNDENHGRGSREQRQVGQVHVHIGMVRDCKGETPSMCQQTDGHVLGSCINDVFAEQ